MFMIINEYRYQLRYWNTKRMNNIIDYKIIEDLLAKIRPKIDNSFQIRGYCTTLEKMNFVLSSGFAIK